jgi:hypothetical protein
MRATLRIASCILLTLISVMAWSGIAAAQPGSPARASLRRDITEVCWVDRWRPAECISIEQLRRTLSKNELDQLLATLDRLLEQSGIDSGHDALVECGPTRRAVVASILPGKTPPKRAPTPGSTGLKRLSGRISGCAGHVASFVGGPGRVADKGRQQWIDDTVAQVDAELAACRDAGNSQIAKGGSSKTTERQVKGVMDMPTPPPPSTTPTTDPKTESSALLVKTKHSSDTGSSGSAPSASPPPEKPKTSAPPPKEPTPSGVRRGTTSPCPAGADCAPTCAEKQARWAAFKDMCEQSDWQAYPCVDFLRKVNGCVDASLINPGPDGDLTCPTRSRATPAERMRGAWEANCKRRQMFVTPVAGGEICKRPDEPMPARVDICTDPRAMPSEDQCTGPTGGSGPGQPTPKPKPDPRRPGGTSPPG